MIIDKLLNKVTMYRLTLYYLLTLIGVATIVSLFGTLTYSPFDIAINTTAAILVSVITNYIGAKIFGATTNSESAIITALILVLIVPIQFPANFLFLIGACIAAMGSKYVLTIEKQHVFNPAAVALVAIALLSPEHTATWWVGTPAMMPFVIIGGLLLVRRIRRERVVALFAGAYILTVTIASLIHVGSIDSLTTTLSISLIKSPLWFLGFVMLTEPLTAPARKKFQYMYAAFVGLLTATPQLKLFGIIFSPEEALCIGNIFAYIVSNRVRLDLILKEKTVLANNVLQFTFQAAGHVPFLPGQYMEWTLPHKETDSRGNRRYFSILSSPSAEEMAIGVKFYDQSSSYKLALYNLEPGERVIAAQLAGDFVLPKNLAKKHLVFIAGGIGITPFISMIQSIIDTKTKCNITLFYSNNSLNDIAFIDTLEKARALGVQTIYTLTNTKTLPKDWQWETGFITEGMIKRHAPHYEDSIYYISGPQLMVQTFEKMLRDFSIPKRNVHTDYFPGFA